MSIKTNKVTIKDIASATGLSPATVGRVFSSPEIVKQKTIDVVMKAAAELGYQPSLAGKALRTGKSYEIAIMLPFDRQGLASTMGAAQYNLIARFSSQLHQHGYNMKLLPYTSQSEMNEVFDAYLTRFKPDAFVVTQLTPQDHRLIRLAQAQIPTVTFGESDLDLPLHRFDFDNYQFTHDAVDHLLQQGKTRITFVVVDDEYMHYAHQLHGFKEAVQLHASNPEVTFNVVRLDANHQQHITEQLTPVVKSSDGIITVSAHFVYAIKQIANQFDIHIGKDISLCCSSATPQILQMLDIPLHCYYQDFTLAGERLSELALAIANQNPAKPTQLKQPYQALTFK